MRHPRLAAAILLAAFAASNAAAQTVVGPPGTYTVQTQAQTTVEYGQGWVRISWTGGPLPPIPPSPIPIPPPVPPVVEWGPLDRVVVMYESTKLTGREPFYSLAVVDALNQTAPADATTKVPSWRIWDKDVDASREPDWADAMTKAKGGFDAEKGPVLYAVDKQGRLKTIPLQGVTDVDAAAKIKALATGAK